MTGWNSLDKAIEHELDNLPEIHIKLGSTIG